MLVPRFSSQYPDVHRCTVFVLSVKQRSN